MYRCCNYCNKVKPLTEAFFYHQYKEKAKFQFRCKECQKLNDRQKYLKDQKRKQIKALTRYHRLRKEYLKKYHPPKVDPTEECDLCHNIVPITDVVWNLQGQKLYCKKCN